MRSLVEALCSEKCAGRATGTAEGRAARDEVIAALRDAGLDPHEQPVPACNGANVIASVPGDVDRWVLVAAHYDHLGRRGREVFWGADDNAAAVAILVEVARSMARERPRGRGVLVAAFDAEEPPWFGTDGMGSEHFVREPPVPLDRIDMMVCMDLVGHPLGDRSLPDEVHASMFVLGSERSEGTAQIVDASSRSEAGLVVRRMDASVITPLSDYEPFWRRDVPFAFLSNGRSNRYHTPDDRPEHLDYAKMAAEARWLTGFVRSNCARPDSPVAFLRDGRDDAATLRAVSDVTRALTDHDPRAKIVAAHCDELLRVCDGAGRLPSSRRGDPSTLVGLLESALA